MSVEYCHKHHFYFDTDFEIECPHCVDLINEETENQNNNFKNTNYENENNTTRSNDSYNAHNMEFTK